jgi:hypothetical protein
MIRAGVEAGGVRRLDVAVSRSRATWASAGWSSIKEPGAAPAFENIFRDATFRHSILM